MVCFKPMTYLPTPFRMTLPLGGFIPTIPLNRTCYLPPNWVCNDACHWYDPSKQLFTSQLSLQWRLLFVESIQRITYLPIESAMTPAVDGINPKNNLPANWVCNDACCWWDDESWSAGDEINDAESDHHLRGVGHFRHQREEEREPKTQASTTNEKKSQTQRSAANKQK